MGEQATKVAVAGWAAVIATLVALDLAWTAWRDQRSYASAFPRSASRHLFRRMAMTELALGVAVLALAAGLVYVAKALRDRS